ncbi:MAG TPA: RNA polymerase sigma factor [Thermoanaerobaculia bacterium]|nr:RNA polymerase sigma factor [Thermoanaerobaculia bacterium]
MRDTESPAPSLEAEVAKAVAGDRDALEAVVHAVQKDLHVVALRFLWHPQDAEDATQEILIRLVTGLSSFRGDSSFRTWAYRIACNTLLTLRRKGRLEQQTMSFDEFGEDLGRGLSDRPPTERPEAEQALLLEETKIGCTLAMLACLDRPHRLAYIVGEIVELDHREGAEVLEISPAAFRKRLSRARTSITDFMMARCGLANPANACRCRRRVDTAVALGRVDPARLLFASSLEQARRFPQVLVEIRQLEATRRAAALYRSHPEAHPPAGFSAWLRKVIEARTPARP